jgi:predicted CoA-binding protein
MVNIPEPVADFLRGKRSAVAGLSRGAGQAANLVYRNLRDSGYETLPVTRRLRNLKAGSATLTSRLIPT